MLIERARGTLGANQFVQSRNIEFQIKAFDTGESTLDIAGKSDLSRHDVVNIVAIIAVQPGIPWRVLVQRARANQARQNASDAAARFAPLLPDERAYSF